MIGFIAEEHVLYTILSVICFAAKLALGVAPVVAFISPK